MITQALFFLKITLVIQGLCCCKVACSVQLCATPQVAAHQAPPSLGFSRQDHWMGCHFLLQCMKVKSESEVAQLCPILCDSMDCSLPGSSVHGIFQARVLEWGAIAFSDTGSLDALYSFFLPNCSGQTSTTMLNKSGKHGHLCLFLILKKNFQLFTTEQGIINSCGLVIYSLDYIPSMPILLRVFIINGC